MPFTDQLLSLDNTSEYASRPSPMRRAQMALIFSVEKHRISGGRFNLPYDVLKRRVSGPVMCIEHAATIENTLHRILFHRNQANKARSPNIQSSRTKTLL